MDIILQLIKYYLIISHKEMYNLLKTSDGSGIGFKSIVIEKSLFFILKNQQKCHRFRKRMKKSHVQFRS